MHGVIKGITGEGGIRTIHFEDDSSVHIDGGFGMRTLCDVAESLGRSALVGMGIEYEADGCGVMLGFTPDEEAE